MIYIAQDTRILLFVKNSFPTTVQVAEVPVLKPLSGGLGKTHVYHSY